MPTRRPSPMIVIIIVLGLRLSDISSINSGAKIMRLPIKQNETCIRASLSCNFPVDSPYNPQ